MVGELASERPFPWPAVLRAVFQQAEVLPGGPPPREGSALDTPAPGGGPAAHRPYQALHPVTEAGCQGTLGAVVGRQAQLTSFVLFFFFNFLRSFGFTAKVRRRRRAPCCTPPSLPAVIIPEASACVTNNEVTLTHRRHQSPLHIRVLDTCGDMSSRLKSHSTVSLLQIPPLALKEAFTVEARVH